PDYIPRPRNAFIIFRCEYAPTHKRGTAGAPVKGTPDSQKTLSGRAGEVWKSMSEAERAVYKARAEQEKVAHALRNPDYRFQPDRKR
ncbi:HMG-box, partial [Auriscalpium vulgare]